MNLKVLSQIEENIQFRVNVRIIRAELFQGEGAKGIKVFPKLPNSRERTIWTGTYLG